ncbi:acetyl-CoA carboxylase biotin carboxylase subunit [Actinomycetospora sp. NBRC 106375]|uniref:acetyl-CoA carboxylase biotin carboxylase subunit n=1 Tax=Actinomycetospora sp. NBRC 106375 TaxID=3032207 RepID=UPI0024A20FAE|nr:biotin carboxylase N-terminal domain-containing protein [Actinomycetospora sp. NBRC 106375]GLZ50241.1 acetyl-CoA carboxylase biotin carboxylase subunit [Actinomycetospora sp. NBRC 106375]
MSAIKRLLIANRGEIATRVARAAGELGIETVLAASAADADSVAATTADRAVVIGPGPSRSSYLRPELIVHAAQATGCDAVHPGFGFLSERASFAELCESEGLTFVGPTANSIRAVGDKLGARALAKTAGVPMASGSGEVRTVDEAREIADGIGYPVITKASAGGGGRGMMVIDEPADLAESYERAATEAREAFGDGRLYLERFLPRARHIEVQVIGDGRGTVLHVGERDCSVQRRHQKMVEEAPAAILDETTRARVHAAAVSLLEPIEYRNAGTVEFLFDEASGDFFFMEVNARLQVEHPVSECVYDVDLVKMQLAVAGGYGLPVGQPDLRPRGHAVEVRILAEDPARGFAPSPGRITRWDPPAGPGVRLDSAVRAGSMVPPYYDSMIAKLIVAGTDRPDALRRLSTALADFSVEGISTNIPLLRRIVADAAYAENTVTTRWLDARAADLTSQEGQA